MATSRRPWRSCRLRPRPFAIAVTTRVAGGVAGTISVSVARTVAVPIAGTVTIVAAVAITTATAIAVAVAVIAVLRLSGIHGWRREQPEAQRQWHRQGG